VSFTSFQTLISLLHYSETLNLAFETGKEPLTALQAQGFQKSPFGAPLHVRQIWCQILSFFKKDKFVSLNMNLILMITQAHIEIIQS